MRIAGEPDLTQKSTKTDFENRGGKGSDFSRHLLEAGIGLALAAVTSVTIGCSNFPVLLASLPLVPSVQNLSLCSS